MKFFAKYIVFTWFWTSAHAQVFEPVILEKEIQEMRADAKFDLHYRQTLRGLKRVYPLALTAKEYILGFEKDLSEMDKKRQKKKYSKEAHQTLKEQFIWDIKDLYISEGILLMKLIHRETGFTVSEIIKKYRGSFHSSMYEGMGKIWEQDLNVRYDPYGDDWITELIINDIIKKRIPFEWKMQPLDKTKYKENMKEYRDQRKEFKKVKRQSRKKAATEIKT